MEYKIGPGDGGAAGFEIADVSDEKFDLVCDVRILGLVLVAHVVLLLLVTGEDADFAYIGAEEALEDGVSETTGAS